jgi:hypothetical protein
MPDRFALTSSQRHLSMHSRRAVARSPSSQDAVDPKETSVGYWTRSNIARFEGFNAIAKADLNGHHRINPLLIGLPGSVHPDLGIDAGQQAMKASARDPSMSLTVTSERAAIRK